MYFSLTCVMNSTCELSYQPHGLLLQPVWDYFLCHADFLLSPYLPVGVAFLSHLLLCAPFLAMDIVGSPWFALNRHKISGKSEAAVCVRLWFNSAQRIFWNYLLCVLPAMAVLHRLRSPKIPALAPTCWQALWQISLCLFLFDALFYFWHVTMHRVSWLYRHIHQVHHQNPDVFALMAQDASAVELLSLQALALCSPALLDCHPLSQVVFHLLNMWLAVEDHCGYDLPWGVHRILPFFGGAPFHQLHHRRPRGNYAPYFKHWDRLFGTDLKETLESFLLFGISGKRTLMNTAGEEELWSMSRRKSASSYSEVFLSLLTMSSSRTSASLKGPSTYAASESDSYLGFGLAPRSVDL